jgi:hypothetical protein
MKKRSRITTHSLEILKSSPKKTPDSVGMIMEDVVISRVMCIGPLESESIL